MMREVQEEDLEIEDKMPVDLRDLGEGFGFYDKRYRQLLEMFRVKQCVLKSLLLWL